MKYLVMECRPSYAVVLSEDGRFLKAANMHYTVGQSVDHITQMSASVPNARRRIIPLLTSIAACLVLLFAGWFMRAASYASVYVTINPQIRIDVNCLDRVLRIAGVNEDGADLLDGYDAARKPLETVLAELADRAIQMDYLHEGGTILLALDANGRWVSTHESALNDHLHHYLEDKISVRIEVAPQSAHDDSSPLPSAPKQGRSDGQTIVIPIAPESDYAQSEYAQSDYSQSDYGSAIPPHRNNAALPDPGFGADGDSGYDAGDSAYDAPDSDGSVHGADSAYAESAYADAYGSNISGDVHDPQDDPDSDPDSDYDD